MTATVPVELPSAIAPSLAPPPPSRPLWMQFGAAALVFNLLYGWGAFVQLKYLSPTKFVIPCSLLVIATAVLAPRGVWSRIRLPVPMLAFIAWWLMSFAWNSWGTAYSRVTLMDLTIVLVIVCLVQVLPFDFAIRTLVVAGYLAIACILVALVVHPQLAYHSSGAAPGLRGGFIHKNGLAPCVIFMALTILCFDRRPRHRRFILVLVAVLLVLARTTTGEATLLILLSAYVALRFYNRIAAAVGRPMRVITIGSTLFIMLLGWASYAPLVRLSGKDLTLSNRTVIWSSVLKVVDKQKFIGYGWDVYLNPFAGPGGDINRPLGFLVTESHNAALELLVRLGIVGLVLYLVMLFTTIGHGWKQMRAGQPIGLFTLLVCLLLIGFGFSESLPVNGVWLGILSVLSALSTTARVADD